MVIADNNNQDVYKWLCNKLGFKVAQTVTVAVLHEDKIVSAVSYFKDGPVCLITSAAENGSWCNPETLSELLRIPFDDLGCRVAKFETSVYNKNANRFCKGIGCVKEGLLRYAHHDGTHQVVWSLTNKELVKKKWYRYNRFNKNRFNKGV